MNEPVLEAEQEPSNFDSPEFLKTIALLIYSAFTYQNPSLDSHVIDAFADLMSKMTCAQLGWIYFYFCVEAERHHLKMRKKLTDLFEVYEVEGSTSLTNI